MNFLKQLVAKPELNKLDRYELAVQLAARWFAAMPNVAPVLTYVRDVADGKVSPNTISDLRNVVEAHIREDAEHQKTLENYRQTSSDMTIQELKAKIEQQEAELNDIHAKHAHERLRADKGWARYDEMNGKFKAKDYEFMQLKVLLEAQKDWGLAWYAALIKCAVYLGIPMGADTITKVPAKLRAYLKNQKFVFINEPKDDWPPVTKKMMTEAVRATIQEKYLAPGIPCNGCTDNCCTLNKQTCVLAKTRKPND